MDLSLPTEAGAKKSPQTAANGSPFGGAAAEPSVVRLGARRRVFFLLLLLSLGWALALLLGPNALRVSESRTWLIAPPLSDETQGRTRGFLAFQKAARRTREVAPPWAEESIRFNGKRKKKQQRSKRIYPRA